MVFWLLREGSITAKSRPVSFAYHKYYSRHQSTSSHGPGNVSAREKIIDSDASAQPAIRNLLKAPVIFLDGEGHHKQSFDPPSVGLSILQIGMPGASEVFIFDMIALSKSAAAASIIQSLKNLLSSRTVLKVGWGGREDLMFLKVGYGLKVAPFLDLQIVDIHSRIVGREGYEEKVKRLASVNFPSREVRKLQIDGIHTLSRMDVALLEHQVDAPLKEKHKGSWLRRPLPSSDIRYATYDIVRISSLWEHFRSASLLRSRLLTDMIIQSAAFMRIVGCPKSRRAFAPNVLPMDILGLTVQPTGSSVGAAFFTHNRDVRACRRCLRVLDIDSFPFSSRGVVVNGVFQGDRRGARGDLCRVCAFVSARENFEIKVAMQKALKFMSENKLT